MPAVPVFVAQLLARFFFQPFVDFFFEDRLAKLLTAEGRQSVLVGFTLTRSYTSIVIVVNGGIFCG
jgi:hypothetical protein